MSQDSKEESSVASAAATKIQANFRGYRVRKQLQESKGQKISLPEEREGSRLTTTATASANTAVDPEKDRATLRNQEERSNDLEERSATKIQAGVRGFLVRKRQRAAQTAATKIQAGFRGFRARKLLKQNGQ